MPQVAFVSIFVLDVVVVVLRWTCLRLARVIKVKDVLRLFLLVSHHPHPQMNVGTRLNLQRLQIRSRVSVKEIRRVKAKHRDRWAERLFLRNCQRWSRD